MLSAIKLQFFPNPTKNYPRKTSLPKISSQIPSPSRPSHEFIKLPRGAKPPSEKAKRGANLPSEMAYCGQLASERRSLKRSLEIAEAGAVSLGGSVVASHSQVGTHGSIPPHSTIRQRINCRGAIFCARPSMPPARLYSTI